jgi:DNA-directed RNA polymerase specialized sigma24 family protein
MNKEIQCFLNRNYYQLLTISKKITKNDQLSQDLLHECLLQVLEKENIVLKSYDDNSIKYYITAIMRINYYSKTSPFYYKIKRERILMTVDINSCWDMSYEQEEFESEQLLQLLELNYAELDFFKKSLLDMYLTLNSSMKAVSRKTRIPISSISRYIKEIRLEVKTKILNSLNNED